MVVAPENNLIPYPGHQYQVQLYAQDNRIAIRQHQQGPARGQKLLGRSYSGIRAHAGHFGSPGRYDFNLSVQKPAFDQLGLVVDVYA